MSRTPRLALALHGLALTVGLSSACQAVPPTRNRSPADAAAAPAPAFAATRAPSKGRFVSTGSSIVDVATLTSRPLPENTLSHTVMGDLLIHAVGSTLVARSLVTDDVRWSSPIPEREGFQALIAATDERVFVVGNPDGVAGYSLTKGELLFERELPKATGGFAAHAAVTSPRGIAFLGGRAAGVFVTNAGAVIPLLPPSGPKGADAVVLAVSLQLTELGPCIAYHVNERWQALRCFDDGGRVLWERDWAEGRLFLAPCTGQHVLLSTQGHVYDDSPRSLVLSARDGAVVLDAPRASGALVEGSSGKLMGVVGWDDGRVVSRAADGGELWSVPYPWRGLVTAVRADEDVVFLAHPMVPRSSDTTLELVRVDAGGKERWRTRMPLAAAPRQEVGAIGLSVVEDRLVVRARGAKTTVAILSFADGRPLFAMPR
jgi:hypothetical protein